MVALAKPAALIEELEAMASLLDALDLSFDQTLVEERDRLAVRIRTYLLPRLTTTDSPLSVVFAGPTGSGKSTLVNTIAGIEVSKTGPIRPTTRSPVVLTADRHADMFQRVGGVDCAVLTGQASILDTVAVIDTPDIDSTAVEHRVLAERLIENADVVVFVTSALRYADLVPWQVLRRAQSRGAPVVFILNRLTPDSSGAVVDFKARLADAGFDSDLLRVSEHHLGHDAQAVPTLAVQELRRRLVAFAKDIETNRAEITERVLQATMAGVGELVELADDNAAEFDIRSEQRRIAFLNALGKLDLSGVVQPLALETPPTRGWLRTKRWLRSNRLTAEEAERYQSDVSSGVRVRVEVALGALAVAADTGLAGTLATATRPVLDSALNGWFGTVESKFAAVADKDRPLASVAVMAATLGRDDHGVTEYFLGLDRDLVVGTLRQELRQRLEVVFTFAAGLTSPARTNA